MEQTETTAIHHAMSMGDSEVSIYRAELYLMRRVMSTSSDLVKARTWPEFCVAVGGLKEAEEAHARAVADLERWYSDGE